MTAKRQPKPPRQNFFALADVRSHLLTALRFAAERAETELREDIEIQFVEPAAHESPIEAVFAIWWIALDRRWGPGDDIALRPQHAVTCGEATYRLDFVVAFTDGDTLFDAQRFDIPVPGIAVELDGHDFHERTKEQVERRNQRDRDLQAAGWKIFHFAGSEVMRDPQRCVEEVRHYAAGVAHRLWGQCYERKKQEHP